MRIGRSLAIKLTIDGAGSSTMAKLTGSPSVPRVYARAASYSTTTIMYVVFHSDSATSRRGFVATYNSTKGIMSLEFAP